MAVIVLNAIIIYLIDSGVASSILSIVDVVCTIFFMIEMTIKLKEFGWRGYWRDGWNRFDGVLVFLSLPSLVTPFLNMSIFNFSILFTFRLLRALRLFRLVHIFPDLNKLLVGLRKALRKSGSVLIGFVILIAIFGLINCSLFKEAAPQYFSTPRQAIYTMFRIVTVEGWYEIPDAIASATSPIIGHFSRFYFCILLSIGGILGLSFINSVFVDAMVEDNNDDVKEQLRDFENEVKEQLLEIGKKVDEVLKKDSNQNK